MRILITVAALSLTPLAAWAQLAPGYITGVTIGAIDPNGKVPAVNAVPGAGVGNWDDSFPLAVLTHGVAYVVSVTSAVGSYSGTCEASYILTSASGTRLVSGKIKSFTCSQGTVWAWDIYTKALPDVTGPAKLTGVMKFGTSTVRTTIPVYVQ